jgi:ubiquinone/menaquinone biosynthesis C-methylase UbiE
LSYLGANTKKTYKGYKANMNGLQKVAPNLAKVLTYIGEKSIFQKKATNRIIQNADQRYIDFAEDVIIRLNRAIGQGESHEYLADAYLAYTKAIRIEEMYFAKEKKYRYSDFAEVFDRVYGRDDYMFDYVVGLGMTQIFWPNHYQIFKFYQDSYLPKVNECEFGVEVGVGHGLFHAEMLRIAPQMKSFLLDISPTSLNMTRNVIAATGLDPNRATPKLCDIQKDIPLEDASLDALLMGEIIEHIQNGSEVLAAMSRKMKSGGYCFFTTAANAPAEDHILLFRTLDEIRDLLNSCGWRIVEEIFITIAGMSLEQAEREGHNINYASVLVAQ